MKETTGRMWTIFSGFLGGQDGIHHEFLMKNVPTHVDIWPDIIVIPVEVEIWVRDDIHGVNAFIHFDIVVGPVCENYCTTFIGLGDNDVVSFIFPTSLPKLEKNCGPSTETFNFRVFPLTEKTHPPFYQTIECMDSIEETAPLLMSGRPAGLLE